jgi:hypothetical protein
VLDGTLSIEVNREFGSHPHFLHYLVLTNQRAVLYAIIYSIMLDCADFAQIINDIHDHLVPENRIGEINYGKDILHRSGLEGLRSQYNK